jgi:hypothetical protein
LNPLRTYIDEMSSRGCYITCIYLRRLYIQAVEAPEHHRYVIYNTICGQIIAIDIFA